MKKRRTKESATYTWQIDNEKSKSETVQKYKCLDENHGYMFLLYNIVKILRKDIQCLA